MNFENSIWHDYHESSKDLAKGHPPIPYDDNLWPESWKTVHYKDYVRLPKVSLPDPNSLNLSLTKTLCSRCSSRSFANEPLSLKELSSILFWSCKERCGSGQRPYPSGGGRYPVEIYLANLRATADFPEGLFHYDTRTHRLDVLWEKQFSTAERSDMFGYPWAKKASVIILMSGVFWRTIEKYGERGYRFVLLEAGHIGQNIALTAAAHELRTCFLGGINERYFESVLDLDTDTESLVYSLVVGK